MTMVNNAPILEFIDASSSVRPRSSSPPKRRRLKSSPCLPARLPSTAILQREADGETSNTFAKQLAYKALPASPHDAIAEALNSSLDEPVLERPVTPSSPVQPPLSGRWGTFSRTKSKTRRPWQAPQSFEVLSAIDKKDVMFLMEVRDRAFELLLRKAPNGSTPLLYAMKLGKSHQEVAIILVGAFSRFVNHLDDADFKTAKTKELLKALRTNLKLAIDYGLQSSQSDLISSFLQTLIMSEGERWVNEQVANAASALRSGSTVKPVDATRSAVRSFATWQLKSLGKGQAIASLDDYVANATGDLLLMGAWSMAALSIGSAESIPTWYFARDDRVYKAFSDRINQHKSTIQVRCSKRLKWQIRVLLDTMDGRTTSWRTKVDVLEEILDSEESQSRHTQF